jgi:polar amino acid transport system permease protein
LSAAIYGSSQPIDARSALPTSPKAPAAVIWQVRRRVLVGLAQYFLVAGGAIWLVYRGGAAMQYTWQWDRVWPFILTNGPDGVAPGRLSIGLFETLRISAIAALLALTLGFLLALGRLSSSWSATRISGAVVGLIRNTPLIVQISMFYFVLAPIIGVSRFWTGVLSLSLFEAAFQSEIIRAGILAVPVGQWEAGMAMGLSRFRILRHIVLPQAFRIMLPPMTSAAISLVKNSSIVSVIALFELTTAGRNAISDTYMSFEIWLTVAAIYLVLTLILSGIAQQAERRMSRPYLA